MIPIIAPKKIKILEKNYLFKFKNKEILQNRAVKGIVKIILNQKPSEVIIFFGPGMNGKDGLKVGKLISKKIGSENVTLVSCIEDSLENKDLGTIKGNFIKHYKKGTDVKLLLQPEDLEHDDQSNLKLEVVDRKFRGTNFIYTLKTNSNLLIPVFVHSHIYFLF